MIKAIIIATCLVASVALVALLASMIEQARAAPVVVRCYKPWLSSMDERAACAIEDALTRKHAGSPRPLVDLKTMWRVK